MEVDDRSSQVTVLASRPQKQDHACMRCLVIDDQTIFLDLLAALVESFPEIARVSKADCV